MLDSFDWSCTTSTRILTAESALLGAGPYLSVGEITVKTKQCDGRSLAILELSKQLPWNPVAELAIQQFRHPV